MISIRMISPLLFSSLQSPSDVRWLQSRQYVGRWAGLGWPTAPHKKGHFMKFMLMVIWVLIEPCDGVIVSTYYVIMLCQTK